MQVIDDKIKFFQKNDLKLLGELLCNNSSRKIIKLISKKPSYTNEISTALDMRWSLVNHHLKKMEELEILKTEYKQIINPDKVFHKFFSINDINFGLNFNMPKYE